MRELEIVQPFVLGNYRLTDLREASPAIKKQVSQIRQDTIHLYPHDLFCRCTTGRDADERARRAVLGDEEATAKLNTRIEAINKEGVRSSLDEYLGEIRPLDFVLHRSGEFFGAVQLFGVKVIAEQEEGVAIECGWWPAFPVRASIEQVIRLMMEVATELLDKRMLLEGGRVLDVQRWQIPIIEDTTRSAELGLVLKTLSEATERVELDVEKVDIPGQAGRSRLRLTRSMAPRETRADPFDTARSGD